MGIELSPKYAAMARDRIVGDSPLLNSAAEEAVALTPVEPPLTAREISGPSGGQ